MAPAVGRPAKGASLAHVAGTAPTRASDPLDESAHAFGRGPTKTRTNWAGPDISS